MIPWPLFSVLWGEEDIPMLSICFRDSKFTNRWIRRHSIIKRLDHIFVTFLTSRAQPFLDYKRWQLCKRYGVFLLFKTINFESKSLTPILSVITFSFFLFSDLIKSDTKEKSRCHVKKFTILVPIYHGRCLISKDLRQKVSRIPRIVYSNRRISRWT